MFSKYLDVNVVKENVAVVYGFVNSKLNDYFFFKLPSGPYNSKRVLAGAVVVLVVGST